jgi:hypothetical protein
MSYIIQHIEFVSRLAVMVAKNKVHNGEELKTELLTDGQWH